MRVAAPNIPMLCTGNIVILSSATESSYDLREIKYDYKLLNTHN